MRDSRPNSFSASFLTSSGMPASSIFFFRSSTSRWPFILLAQFFLDRLHLLAQVILALRLLHAVLHFALNLVAQLLDFKFLRQMLVDFFQPHVDVESLQRVLFVGRRQRRQATTR